MHHDIEIKTETKDQRCTVTSSVNGKNTAFWIDFSLQDIDEEKINFYAVEIALGWLIAVSKRDGATSVSLTCSHAPRRSVIESWCLLSQTILRSLTAEKETIIRGESQKKLEPGVCVSWGGGKDSYAALDIISKVAKDKKKFIFDFTSHSHSGKVAKKISRRKMLTTEPTKEKFGADSISVTSNAPSQMQMPNSANYFSFLPFLSAEYGIDMFCYSFESMFFYDGSSSFQFPVGRSQHYDMSRTLSAKILSLLMGRVTGREFNIFNANYQFTEYSAFIYVAKHCQDGLSNIMMCEIGGDEKWCGACTKCAQMVLYSLSLDVEQKEIDPNHFLSNSPWVEKALSSDETWYKGLTYPGHIDSFRFVLSKIPEESISELSETAQKNLRTIISKHADSNTREEDGIFAKNLFASWPPKYAPEVYKYLSELLPVYESPKFEKHWGRSTVLRNEELQATTRATQFIGFLLEQNDALRT